MSDSVPEFKLAETECARRMRALSRWENEGGAGLAWITVDAPFHSDAEAEQLRIRVIALENLVIALLADATDDQRTQARDMADSISPRPGYIPHPMTLRALKRCAAYANVPIGTAPASTLERGCGDGDLACGPAGPARARRGAALRCEAQPVDKAGATQVNP